MPWNRVSPDSTTSSASDDTSEVAIKDSRFSRFNELVVGERFSRFNLKPTWGLSNLRDSTTLGSGSTIAESSGEFKLSTGTNTAGSALLETKERGQYQAGTMGEAGIAIRIPTDPAGDAFAEWGYWDQTNGFGFGVDFTGIYVFYETGGTQTKTYQTDWNTDVLDGTGSSGLTLDLADGNIFEIAFVWYGHYRRQPAHLCAGLQRGNFHHQLRCLCGGQAVLGYRRRVHPADPHHPGADGGQERHRDHL